MSFIAAHKSAIQVLCASYHVKALAIFGSAVSNKFSAESDVDFVVTFNAIKTIDYADNYFGLKSALEKLLNRKVDLLEEKALKNPYLKESINSTKQLIYGA